MEVELKYTIPDEKTAEWLWSDEELGAMAEEGSWSVDRFRGLYYDTEDHMLTKNDIAFMLSATAFSQLPSSAWKFLIWQGKIDCKTQVSCVGDSPFMAVRRICPPP